MHDEPCLNCKKQLSPDPDFRTVFACPNCRTHQHQCPKCEQSFLCDRMYEDCRPLCPSCYIEGPGEWRERALAVGNV